MNPSVVKGYQTYQKNKYETASPHRLIAMLYAGAIRNVKHAAESLDQGEHKVAHQLLLKSQDIIFELISSLNEAEGGEIARNLKQLYLYMIEQLAQANMNKTSQPLPVVIDMLESISSAWNEIGKTTQAGTQYA